MSRITLAEVRRRQALTALALEQGGTASAGCSAVPPHVAAMALIAARLPRQRAAAADSPRHKHEAPPPGRDEASTTTTDRTRPDGCDT